MERIKVELQKRKITDHINVQDTTLAIKHLLSQIQTYYEKITKKHVVKRTKKK